MIQEYALDPEMLANEFPNDARFFREAFGPNSIRFLSCFPKRWKDDLKGAFKRSVFKDDVLAQQAVMAFGHRLLERAVKRNHGNLVAGGWLTKAEHEHSKNPFHAILTKENPNGNEAVIRLEDVHEHPMWNDPRKSRPERNATSIASVVEPLLIRAPEIIFVDPYFDIIKDEYRPAFEAYFDCIGKNLVTSKPRITMITGLKHAWEQGVREPAESDITEFEKECKEILPIMMSPGCIATVAIVKEFRGGEELHDRFILTKHAAIQFGKGLGCSTGRNGSCVNLSLDTYGNGESTWELYNLQRQPAAFDVIYSFTVQE